MNGIAKYEIYRGHAVQAASEKPAVTSLRNSRLEPWLIINSEEVLTAPPRITVSKQKVCLPEGKIIEDYYKIKLQEYVVVFAQVLDGRIAMEQQYKHGVGKVTVTLPSGLIEDGEIPQAAAERELLEETGYISHLWQSLGSFVPHGNYGCGRAHLFLARDVYEVASPDSGDLEDTQILMMEPGEVLDAIRNGVIEILSTVTATFLALSQQLTASNHEH